MVRIGLLVLGAWTAVVGMLVHRHVLVAGGVVWPWGLVLVLFATWVTAHASSGLQRIGGAWFALGWTLTVLLEQVLGGASYLVTTDWIGWSFMLGGVVVIGLDLVAPSRVRA